MGSWSVWWHPRRSFRRIEELEKECARLAEELDEKLKEAITVREKRIKELEDEVIKSVEECRELTENNRKLSEELRLKSESLTEWEEMRPELERVAEAMDRMEQMKEDYNRRIRKLQQQLDDARHGSFRRQPDNNDEVSDILDFDGDTPFAAKSDELSVAKRDKNDKNRGDDDRDDGWLQFL